MTARFRQLYIGSNLKMYKTNRQTVELVQQIQTLTADLPRPYLRLFILPSYTALADACRLSNPDLLWVGAQNMHWDAEGPFTGEVSPLMLRDIGVKLVMVGHAERRQLFGETDAHVNRRVISALAHGLHTLVCVGETLVEKQAGASEKRLQSQLCAALKDIPPDQLDKLWVAYEPVWSIGVHGTPANPEIANTMHAVIRQTLADLFPVRQGDIPILYGGSVNLDNASDLISQPEVDGLFIGRAAWDAANFDRILRVVLHRLEVGSA
jgi:triosephosphate isomerase